jgi:hypothetical protein
MATLLDWIEERHDGPEPRVLVEDVQRILQAAITDDEHSVSMIAEGAGVSTRTVYRVLTPPEDKVAIGLDLADRLCVAAGSHLKNCRLITPGGEIVSYEYLPGAKLR